MVFVTACSLGFAAFALSLVAGGPNWKIEADAEDFTNDYLLTVAPGEKPTYSIKDRRTDGQVPGAKTSPLLAEVVIAGRKQQVEVAKAEEARLNADIAKKLKPILAEMKALVPPDQEALVGRAMSFDKVLTQISENTQATAKEFIARSASIKQIQETSQERREEVVPAEKSGPRIATHRSGYVAKAQQRILEDELVRVEENLKRLERRETQLKTQVKPYD